MTTASHSRRQRRAKLSRKALAELLAPTATTSERVRGLLGLGLQPIEIAKAVGVGSTSTLRNWIASGTEPRPDAVIVLDDLRATAKILLDGNLEPERIVSWLMSRDPLFDSERPIDLLPSTPMRVLSAAHAVVIQASTPT